MNIIEKTMKYLDNAYTPYSHFNVAACVETKDNVYFGANIENASYGLSNCAERSALFHAYSEGVRKEDILSLTIVTKQDELIFPCGACRQVMVELLNPNTKVIISNGVETMETNIAELMPHTFSQEQLR